MAVETRKNRQTIPILCKVVELVSKLGVPDQCLTIIIVGLIVDPINNGILALDQNHSGIVYVAWPGYIIINTVIILGYLIGDRLPKRTSMLFSFVGAILFMAASSTAIHDWRKNQVRPSIIPSKQYQDMTISAAVFGIFTSLIMFFETAIHALYIDDDDEE